MTAGQEGWKARRDVLCAARAALAAVPDVIHACGSDELADVLAELSELATRVEAARMVVVREAMSRGVVASSDAACPADWVAEASGPGTQRRDALALARVAATCALPKYRVVDDVVRDGRVPVGMADVVLREFAKLRLALDESMHDDVLAGLVTLAEQGCSPRQLAGFRDRLIGRYGADGALDRRDDRLHARRGMSAFGQDLHGMLHAVLVLDPQSHAVIASVIDTLSAPVTSGDGERDDRSADQRRLDALVEVCAAYQGLGPKARLGVSTRLVVTMALSDLLAGTGCGLTPTGDVLSPAAVRALACDAGIIPMVLGSESQPLDMGRESRLATPAQIVALGQRDKGCSFPGCQRPPGWCQVHHVAHWLQHIGPTNLDNLALLCHRHHTIVHQRGYTATVTSNGVTWHTGGQGRPPPGTQPHPAE